MEKGKIKKTNQKRTPKTKINKHEARKKDVDKEKMLTRHVWLRGKSLISITSMHEKDLRFSRNFRQLSLNFTHVTPWWVNLTYTSQSSFVRDPPIKREIVIL